MQGSPGPQQQQQGFYRVKVYKLNETGGWDDKGTGLASVGPLEVKKTISWFFWCCVGMNPVCCIMLIYITACVCRVVVVGEERGADTQANTPNATQTHTDTSSGHVELGARGLGGGHAQDALGASNMYR
jgi:hypothetical protein